MYKGHGISQLAVIHVQGPGKNAKIAKTQDAVFALSCSGPFTAPRLLLSPWVNIDQQGSLGACIHNAPHASTHTGTCTWGYHLEGAVQAGESMAAAL